MAHSFYVRILFVTEPVCSNGQLPIPERTCGGLLPGNECPRGYTCVGDLVPVDGPGVCCPTDPGQCAF